MGIPVLLPEVVGKGFVAPLEALLGFGDEGVVLVVAEAREVGPIQVAEGPLKMRWLVGKPGTHIDFYALDSIKDNKAKTPVESIGIPNLAKAGAVPKRIIIVPVRIQISAQSVVADCLEMGDENVSLSHSRPREMSRSACSL